MLKIILHLLCSIFRSRQSLALENLALRHQLYVLQRPRSRIRVKKRDRLFWIVLSRIWRDWRHALAIVRPETVVRWHREGFHLYWRWKSRANRRGRPRLTLQERKLIHRMAEDNPLWGAPHIHGELLKLGIVVSQATVSKYMARHKPPSLTWRTFLRNHAKDIVSVDFFTVPTATFRVLYVLLVVTNARRFVVHFNVTTSPSADRDDVYGKAFVERVNSMGIDHLLSAPRSPWQNPYVERLVGSSRTHLDLEKDCPTPRQVEHPVSRSASGGDVAPAIPTTGYGHSHRIHVAALFARSPSPVECPNNDAFRCGWNK